MASWKTVLTVNGQGDSLSPLLYVIATIPMTTIFRQTGLGYQTSKSAAKISHLLYKMDDLKLYGKSSDELESLLNAVRIFSKEKQPTLKGSHCQTTTREL